MSVFKNKVLLITGGTGSFGNAVRTPLRIILLCVIAATRHSILTTLLQIANVRRDMKRFYLFCTGDAVYLLQIIRQQIQGLIVRFERLFRKLLHAAMGQELFDLSVDFTHKKHLSLSGTRTQ